MKENKFFRTDVMIGDYNYTEDVRRWKKQWGEMKYSPSFNPDLHIPNWYRKDKR